MSHIRSIFLLCILLVISGGCNNGDIPRSLICTSPDFGVELVNKSNPLSCSQNTGSITVVAFNGEEPYSYKLNSGTFTDEATFDELGAGNYSITAKDNNGCESVIEIQLVIPGEGTLSATAESIPDTECIGSNGSITINATGGTGSYQYKIGTNSYGANATFSSLSPGTYTLSVKDANECVFTLGVSVLKGNTETSLVADVKPIIETRCAITNCHNGSQSPDLRTSSAIIANALKIKSETQSGSMPRGSTLDASQKALIACWVDEGALNN